MSYWHCCSLPLKREAEGLKRRSNEGSINLFYFLRTYQRFIDLVRGSFDLLLVSSLRTTFTFRQKSQHCKDNAQDGPWTERKQQRLKTRTTAHRSDSADGICGCALRSRRMETTASRTWKGSWPVSMLYRITPADHTSMARPAAGQSQGGL